MLIERRLLSNLRSLLLVVICLGTVQYLLGSYILNLTTRNRLQAATKGDVAALSPDVFISGEYVQPVVSASYDDVMEVTSRNTDINSTVTTSLVSKIEAAVVTQLKQDVQISKIADNVTKAEINVTIKANTTIFCDELPPGLGPFKVNTTTISLLDVEEKYPEVSKGGYYTPPNCTAIHKVAVIVPYRDRLYHLTIFLNNIHPFLMKQQIEYRIFIVEQKGSGPFNRGMLFNVGFLESWKLGYHCFVFHDVHLLPLDTRNMYTCPKQPRHMAPSDDPLSNTTEYFGSVNAMADKQFVKVNGFSNKYWNLGGEDEDMAISKFVEQKLFSMMSGLLIILNKYWNLGGEDEDMAIRLRTNNVHMARCIPSINRYLKLNHSRSIPSPKRFIILKNTEKHYGSDGLSSLEYKVVSTNENHLYTHWMVDLLKSQGSDETLRNRTTPFVDEDESIDIKVSF